MATRKGKTAETNTAETVATGPVVASGFSFAKVSRGVGRSAEPNEYEEYIAQTFGDDAEPLGVTTTRGEVSRVLNRLRAGAERLGLGVTTQIQATAATGYDLSEGDPISSEKDSLARFPDETPMTVVFKAREARKYGPRKKAEDAA